MNEDFKNIPTKDLEFKVANWRKDFVDSINREFAGKNYTDAVVAAAMITSLVDDVHVLLQWVETLACKVKDLENKIT